MAFCKLEETRDEYICLNCDHPRCDAPVSIAGRTYLKTTVQSNAGAIGKFTDRKDQQRRETK